MATSHQPRLRHSNYVMRRDDDAADAAASSQDEISARDGRRHLIQIGAYRIANVIRDIYLYITESIITYM